MSVLFSILIAVVKFAVKVIKLAWELTLWVITILARLFFSAKIETEALVQQAQSTDWNAKGNDLKAQLVNTLNESQRQVIAKAEQGRNDALARKTA